MAWGSKPGKMMGTGIHLQAFTCSTLTSRHLPHRAISPSQRFRPSLRASSPRDCRSRRPRCARRCPLAHGLATPPCPPALRGTPRQRPRCRGADNHRSSLPSSEAPTEQERKMKAYPFPEIEARWQQYWEAHQTFRTPDDGIDFAKPKFYVLDMFPYPSGAGLHVGHLEGYTATDIIARYKRMKGFNVLHPMGWDAFGLPAEQYAIGTGTHPRVTTSRNINKFRQQLKTLGFSYDWQREISTTEPEYYKWTQWIFLQLFKRGLAYQADALVNWCPALGTVLANEEVIDGLSERGGHPVIRKPMEQWMLRITEYADRLLEDLEGLDWPKNVKEMQRNWIGRSEGAELEFEIIQEGKVKDRINLRVFSTRPDTICGATYLAIAPEHPLLDYLISSTQRDEVNSYVEAASRKSELERTELQKDKSGVFSGAYAKNPATGEAMQIWVADYILGSYGSGAIMAVPAHDNRDYEFAIKFALPIRSVVAPNDETNNRDGGNAYTGDGILINSSFGASGIDLNGLSNTQACLKVIDWLEMTGHGRRKVNYKLRDWLFARQRYWGEPFPVFFLEDSGEVKAVPENELPVMLPDMNDFSPTGEPPLAKAKNWIKMFDSESGRPAKREISTMPQWAGSCWYYLRFMDPRNSDALVNSHKERYWGPVDLYVGGAEHSVLHLLYARFWHKVLYDIGVVTTKEPFQCLVNQGIILGQVEYTVYKDAFGHAVSADLVNDINKFQQERISENQVIKIGEKYFLKSDQSVRIVARAYKMSKSRGNVINPDYVVDDYGADSLRLYEMFMGPLSDTKVWNTNGVEGVHRFLARSWRLLVGPASPEGIYADGSVAVDEQPSPDQLRTLHLCIQKVTEEIEGLCFNTAISAMMEFMNSAYKWNNRPKAVLEKFVLLLSPFAPHISEELWYRLGHSESLAYETWPKAEDRYLSEDMITLPVQINGKMRGTIQVPVEADESIAFEVLRQNKYFEKVLRDMNVTRKIYVPKKILNLIVSK